MTHNTILVVDDDDLNVAIMQEILGDDHKLLIGRNGEEAVAKAGEHKPALVLMDIMMPKMDGYEACRQIKKLPQCQMTHVVLVSAKASTAERLKGYEVGADDYLIKPFDEDELLAKVSVQLRLRNALAELAEAKTRLSADNTVLHTVLEHQTHELADSRDLLVFALAKLADSRDPETGEHLERMRCYCKLLAEELSQRGPYTAQVTRTFIDNIYQSSPLHDLGKVGIPDTILLKPGRLTDVEFDIMKHHTLIGSEALEEVAKHSESGHFLQMAVEIARWHHERFDGTGYPDGLAGHDIPLSARITAVADVFDALTSMRVYKSAFTPEIARAMMTNDIGKHFDPAVMEAFLARYQDFIATRDRLNTKYSRQATTGPVDADRAA